MSDHPTVYLRLVLRKAQDGRKPAKAYVIQVEDDDRNDYQLGLYWGTWEAYEQDSISLSQLKTNRRRPRHQGQDLWELKRTAYVIHDRKVITEHFRTVSETELRL